LEILEGSQTAKESNDTVATFSRYLALSMLVVFPVVAFFFRRDIIQKTMDDNQISLSCSNTSSLSLLHNINAAYGVLGFTMYFI